eukprot:gene2607-3567_t
MFTQDNIVEQEVVIHRKTKKVQDFDETFEIEKTAKIILENSFKIIALQFPDDYLEFSNEIVQRLKLKCSKDDIIFYVLGDTSYGSCCVDEVAAQHINADFILHYGKACLEKISKTPVYHIFEKLNLNIDKCFLTVEKQFKKDEKILILFDFEYSHLMEKFKKKSTEEKFENMIISNVDENKKYQNPKLDKGGIEHQQEIKGLCFTLPDDGKLEEYSILYVGEDSTLLSQIMLECSSVTSKFFRYSPEKDLIDNCDMESSKISKLLLKRFYLVEKAKDAEIIGIIVATFSIDKYMEMLNYLKKLIKMRQKKPYVFIIGKLNEPKLANFSEIDVYCLIGCGRNSIIDSKLYMKSIVTPFELQLALERGKEWDGSYATNFNSILNKATKDETVIEEEETRYSLISGGLKKNVYSTNEPQLSDDRQLFQSSSSLVEVKDSLSLLEKRSYKGLDSSIGETETAKIEQGRGGIAKLYGHEKGELEKQ